MDQLGEAGARRDRPPERDRGRRSAPPARPPPPLLPLRPAGTGSSTGGHAAPRASKALALPAASRRSAAPCVTDRRKTDALRKSYSRRARHPPSRSRPAEPRTCSSSSTASAAARRRSRPALPARHADQRRRAGAGALPAAGPRGTVQRPPSPRKQRPPSRDSPLRPRPRPMRAAPSTAPGSTASHAGSTCSRSRCARSPGTRSPINGVDRPSVATEAGRLLPPGPSRGLTQGGSQGSMPRSAARPP